MRHVFLICLSLTAGSALAQGQAHYLANEGLMAMSGETKVLFDPLFREGFGNYQLLPAEMEEALMAGEPPFDGIDAIFISHYHGDHFSPLDVLNFLENNPGVLMYAPKQAADVLLSLAGSEDASIAGRVTGLDINYGDAPMELSVGSLLIEAFHIPHSGWPNRRPEVQNLAFRVTLNDSVTVLHMGDADARTVHFEGDAERWAARAIDAAFPPYWFFLSNEGQQVLENHLKPALATGVHVPIRLDPAWSGGLEGHDLFREPGETRDIPASD